MIIEVTMNNYNAVLPEKKRSMFLQYVENGWLIGPNDSQKYMLYDTEKDQFQLNRDE